MGTICAPLYVNIFMAQFEAKYIYPYILRNIDDIFMIWNGTKEKLILFIDELNKIHKNIKFDYKISTKQIEFLDTMVYRNQQHKIQITIFRKPTDQQTYLDAQSNHHKSLKDNIPYSHPLPIKTICSTTSEFNKNCDIITKRFKERGCLKNLVNEQVDKVKNIKREQLLSSNKRIIQNHIPVVIDYNRHLPIISNIITKNWNILQISPTLQKVFDKKLMITYKRNKNLGELIKEHTLQGGKFFKTHLQTSNGKSKLCNTTKKSSLCCTQVVNAKTSESYQTKRTFKIFHRLNCKSSFVIYLMECTLCRIQYVGKAETPFSIRLNNHRKDANGNNPKASPASIHFKQPGHSFNKHARFTLIEQINNTINTDIDTIKIRLRGREDF